MSKKGLTEKQVNAVLKALKQGTPVAEVAAKAGIKESTVKAVRQAGSYKEYARRKARKVQLESARRAIHPAPRPSDAVAVKPFKAAEAKKVTAVVGSSKPAALRKQRRKKGVAPSQSIKPVAQEAISAFALNQAYEEYKTAEKDLLDKVTSALQVAKDAKSVAKDAIDAVAELQRAETSRSIREAQANRRWWRLGR